MSLIKRFYIPIILIAILAGGFFYFRARNAANNPNVYNPAKDILVTPKTQDISETLTVSGSIDAASKSTVTFPTAGKLAWVGVKVGDRVKKYQALASLDKVQLQKQLLVDFNAYQTTLSQFQDTQDQYKLLKDKYLLTDTDKRVLDRSQWNLGNSVVQYELQDIALRDATIFSPISGIIVDVSQPNSGINITPITATFTVIDPDSIFLKTKIDQNVITRIKPGDTASISLDSFPDQKLDSKINYIAFTPVQGETSTVYEVRFELPSSNDLLRYRIGMDGDATLTLAQVKNAQTVPLDAVLETDNGQKYVYIKDKNNQLSKKNIQTGIENDTDIQVIQGLADNDQVVIKHK